MNTMTLSLRRIYFLMIKEFLSLFKDPKGRFVIIVPPLLQLFVFAFASTLEVKNISMAIYNQDYGRHGYEITHRIMGSPFFTHINFVNNYHAIQKQLDEQHVLAALVIPPDFSRKIEARKTANVLILLDGRRSNSAQIVDGYINLIIQNYANTLPAYNNSAESNVISVGRNWFNQNLIYMWFTVPSLVCILSMLITLVITTLSIARERELGTYDQLLVSPLVPHEILIGKMLPAIIVGLAEGCIAWFVAVTFFQIPFTGSIFCMFLVLFTFTLSIVGVGLFISAIVKTQQQAILGAFMFMVPTVTLSGYAAPVENMPEWLQYATWWNPLTHTLIAVKGLFLKSNTLSQVWPNTWPLLIIALLTLTTASWFFKKRME
jgi:ABC-2 type transport system permease protein